jgi:hypothetical protein
VGYRLRFHKRSADGSGKADAEYTGDPQDSVWGVAFDLESSEKPALDKAEGLGAGYSEKMVTITDHQGEQHAALIYYADNKDPSLKPYSWYLRFVVDGARQHDLPADYIAALEDVDCAVDPDKDRDRANMRVRC